MAIAYETSTNKIQRAQELAINTADNTDVMELAESLLLLSEQQPTSDTLSIDAPKQPIIIREINESRGVETKPIPTHPIPNPAEFENPNTEPQGEKDNADNSDKTVIYNPEEDETDPHNETAVTKGTKYYKTNRYLQSKKSNNQVPEEEGHVFSGRPTTTVDRLA